MPFRRVKDEEVRVDPRLKDNSFEAKVTCRLYVYVQQACRLTRYPAEHEYLCLT